MGSLNIVGAVPDDDRLFRLGLAEPAGRQEYVGCWFAVTDFITPDPTEDRF